jgi:aminoglycoside phosphotransferase (APT) family kinase protein
MPADRLFDLAERASRLMGLDVRITSRLGGGQHALTVVAETDDGAEVVIRAFPAGDDDAVEREVHVLRSLDRLGDWVPRLIASSADPAMPIVITTRVVGGHPAPDLAGAVIAEQMAQALAKVHQLDGARLPSASPQPPVGTSRAAVAAQRAWSQLGARAGVLTHSDFWCGNALWDGPTLTGLVDWVGAHRADRGVDVAWCRLDLVLLGETNAADAFLDEYASRTGVAMADQRLWDLRAAARAETIVETWTPNYVDIGRGDLVPAVLRRRLDAWTDALIAS